MEGLFFCPNMTLFWSRPMISRPKGTRLGLSRSRLLLPQESTFSSGKERGRRIQNSTSPFLLSLLRRGRRKKSHILWLLRNYFCTSSLRGIFQKPPFMCFPCPRGAEGFSSSSSFLSQLLLPPSSGRKNKIPRINLSIFLYFAKEKFGEDGLVFNSNCLHNNVLKA